MVAHVNSPNFLSDDVQKITQKLDGRAGPVYQEHAPMGLAPAQHPGTGHCSQGLVVAAHRGGHPAGRARSRKCSGQGQKQHCRDSTVSGERPRAATAARCWRCAPQCQTTPRPSAPPTLAPCIDPEDSTDTDLVYSHTHTHQAHLGKCCALPQIIIVYATAHSESTHDLNASKALAVA